MKRQQGFTLLEVLAAFLVFSLVFATSLQVLSGSLRNTQRSADYTQAALWAQTALEGIGIEPLLEEGTYNGRFEDGYRWEMEILPFELEGSETLVDTISPGDNNGAASETAVTSLGESLDVPIDLFEIELRVYWGEPEAERMARFRTLRSVTPSQ